MSLQAQHVEKYYTSTERMLQLFERNGRQKRFAARSAEHYAEWKADVRRTLAELTGMRTMERCDALPELLESQQMDGYRRDKMLIQTEPDVWMPLYVLVPDGIAPGTKRPAVIAAHGHGSGGKWSIAQRDDIPLVKRQIEVYNYAYGVRLVREGYVVFCPDARAFGERREWTKQGDGEEIITSSCMQLNQMAIPLGQTVTGMWTWDLMRLADYISTRGDCDSDALGCIGLSGGGLQTIWLAAMDDRIRCAVVSGYFYGYKDSLLRLSNNCSCNYVPGLWNAVDMGDLGALVAPRALHIESGRDDPLNGERGIDNVTEQVRITEQAYRLLGAEEQLLYYIFDGEHRFDGGRAYDFIRRHLPVGG